MINQLKRFFIPLSVFFFALLVVLIVRPSLHWYEPPLTSDGNDSKKSMKKYGIDVSHYQGDINWSLVKKEISFAFVKATDGTSFVDPRYIENSSELLKEGVISGAYHFFEPKQESIKQAELFVKTSNLSGHQLRPVLDIEITDGVSAKEIASNALKWLEYVEEKTGCKPMIYTYASFWDDYLGDKFNSYNYWLADWTQESTPTLPTKRSDWQLWQFNNKGQINGIDGLVDRDMFDNTEQQFDKLLCS